MSPILCGADTIIIFRLKDASYKRNKGQVLGEKVRVRLITRILLRKT